MKFLIIRKCGFCYYFRRKQDVPRSSRIPGIIYRFGSVLMHQALDENVCKDLMEKLFHPENGIGLSVLINLMGASDYPSRFLQLQ